MKKVDRTVLHETGYIALFTVLLSLLMQAVFLAIGKWDYTVLTGNLLGAAVSVGNFFLMGLTVQSALGKEPQEIRRAVRTSQSLRMVLLFAAAALIVALPCFHTVAGLLPLFFPRIAIALRPLFGKRNAPEESAASAAAPEDPPGEPPEEE